MSEDEPTEKELAEAEALARALEHEPGAAPPVDALETAALLRQDALPDIVERRVLERVRPRRRATMWWALAAAAVLVMLLGPIFLFVRQERSLPATALPRPSGQLLAAQARAATEPPEVATLEREMQSYRGALFDALAARYER